MVSSNSMGKVVIAFCAPTPHDVHAIGEMVWYRDHPCAGINTAEHEQIEWAAHLLREATPAETVEYWRERALKAETPDTGTKPEQLATPEYISECTLASATGDRIPESSVLSRLSSNGDVHDYVVLPGGGTRHSMWTRDFRLKEVYAGLAVEADKALRGGRPRVPQPDGLTGAGTFMTTQITVAGVDVGWVKSTQVPRLLDQVRAFVNNLNHEYDRGR